MDKDMETKTEGEGVQTSKPRPGKNFKLLVAGWVLAFCVLFVAFFAVGIYRFSWSGPVVRQVVSILPYPAAVVNWRILSIKEFHDRFEAYKSAIIYNQAFDFNDPSNASIVRQQKHDLLERMIDLKFEYQLAYARNLAVSEDEVEREMQNLYQQTGNSPEEIEKLLAEVYGWNTEQFTRAIIIPQTLENKLRKAVVEDQQINREAYELANTVKQELEKGADFGALAKTYSADSTTKDTDGDLGWAGMGAFVPEFEKVVFAMEPNELSEVTASQYGLHIIQLLGKGESEDGKPQVHARHILFPTRDFAEWLAEQKAGTVIWKFAPT